jgi:hypothetical protein
MNEKLSKRLANVDSISGQVPLPPGEGGATAPGEGVEVGEVV